MAPCILFGKARPSLLADLSAKPKLFPLPVAPSFPPTAVLIGVRLPADQFRERAASLLGGAAS